jgi:FtsP/CotA-like multicopper oxidase with cupredoxin domain
MMRRADLGLALALAACSAEAPPDTDRQPDDMDAELRMLEAVDLSPDPGVVEVELEARAATLEVLPGVRSEVWTYDGALPGPLIRAKVGDRLDVHFRNSLPEPTTIHWHGMRVPVAMDGVPEHSQTIVPPGGTFEYSFVVPDAGLYWYHPHHDSAAQVGNGLYGAIVVDDPAAPPLGDELVLVLSDMGLQADGSLMPADSAGDFGTLFGREGDVLLVNGKQRPTIHARSGKLQRWRIVNTAKSRYFQLAMAGHSFRRIGTDGGLSEYGVTSERIVLAPAERLDVLVVPTGTAGAPVAVRWVAFDRGFGSTDYRPDEPLFFVDFAEAPAPRQDSLPVTSRPIEALDLSGATEVDVELTQGFDADGKLVLGINGLPPAEAEPFHGQIGETQIWRVSTQMEWSHPFHLHGFFFQVLDATGQPRRPLEWKDTVDVPYRGQTSLAVRYEDRPGMWMFHCHILDHAEAGMMGHLHLME